MKRGEMIDILIEDRVWDWVYAHNDDGLREMLYVGFIGFEKYTDQELKDSIEDIEDKVDEIKSMLKRNRG